MPFVRNENGALVWEGYHPETDFYLQASALLGIRNSEVEEVQGRDPTLGEVQKGVPRNKHGLTTKTIQENLFPEVDPRGIQTRSGKYDPQTQGLLEQALKKSKRHH